ncbi:hypothetical protein [Streptomyces sp. NPDC059009]|uniref:hypothetical protein n=1 Tax=Streptomyces sp. NPDC059009 TaxID=3346694 RepID=UPI0036AE23B5
MTLAFQLHLYGTMAGAIVFSVAATVGGPLIQHGLYRAGDGCGRLGRLLRARRAHRSAATARGAGAGRAPRLLVPLAVMVLAVGTVGAAAATAAPGPAVLDHHRPSPGGPPSRDPGDPAERGGGPDKVTQPRADGRKAKAVQRRAS